MSQIFKIINIKLAVRFQFALLLSSVLLTSPVYANTGADDSGLFSVEFIEQVNNVSFINFLGDYNRTGADGEFNIKARQAVAKEFYKNNPDIYDFLVVFTDFEIDTGEARAFHHAVSNSVTGIGVAELDNTELYGSEGKLKGFIDMAALSRYQTNSLVINPLDDQESYEVGLNVLAHELLHQWAAFPAIEELKGRDDSHWNFYLNTDASVQYGSRWRDNGDGTFTAVAVQEKYSQLDLYLMGLIDKTEVDPFYVIRPNGTNDYELSDLPVKGAVVNGTRKDYSIDDLIEAQGERTPSFSDSQKEFKFAFLYLSSQRRITERTYAELNELKKEFATRFSILTSGRAIANVDPIKLVSTPISGQPVLGPNGEVGQQDQASEKAMDWVLSQQNSDGSWSDKSATSIRDTSLIIGLLEELGTADEQVDKARNWLAAQEPANTDSISRRAQVMGDASELDRLVQLQNDDGGWGLQASLESSVLDTSLAICAMATVNSSGFENEIQQGIAYVLSRRNSNGAWSVNQSQQPSVTLTSRVLNSLACAGISSEPVQSTIDWLASQINNDSGFGDAGSTTRETTDAIGVFIRFRQTDKIDVDLALDYILSQQSTAGDWGGSVSTTAQVLEVLRVSRLPNIVVSSVAVEKNEIRDGEIIKVLATLENNGAKPAQASVLSLYEGAPNAGDLVDEIRLPPIAPFRQLEVAFYWNSLGSQGTVELNAVADTLFEVGERSEGDNSASAQVNVLEAPQGVELLINRSELRSTPTQVTTLPTTLSLSAVIHNIGASQANDVTVELWNKEPSNGELLESKTVSLLAKSVEQLTFEFDKTNPADQSFFFVVDPQNRFAEENEDNNSASLVVGSESSVDVSVATDDLILPTAQPLLNELVELGAVIRNTGTLAANDVPVRVFVTNVEGEFDVLTTRLNIEPGKTARVVGGWPVNIEGTSTLRVEVDSVNSVAEADESNNSASKAFESQRQAGKNVSVDFQEFSILPETGFQGMGSTLKATVRNTGTEPVTNLSVAFYQGAPDAGGHLITEETVQSIPASAAAEVVAVWPEVDYQGAQFIYVVVDHQDQVVEFDEQDNQAFLEYQSISLPDFAVSSESLIITPQFPSVGNATEQVVVVSNHGMQSAEGVVIQAYLGNDNTGPLIAESTLDIASSGQAEWTFDYAFEEPGAFSIYVVVDAANAIRELSESNNDLAKEVEVQGGNFFLSDFFISPDSDGVQDTVDYTFNLPEPSNDSVVVINDLGNEVFEFEFDTAIHSDRVTWDGKNRFGGNVSDGAYTIAVKRGPGIYTGQRNVVVDVNRSPISEAFGTVFGIERNLTCRIGEVNELHTPGADSLIYSPDNRFIYFTTFFRPFINANGEEVDTDALHPFPTGLYRAESDGGSVTQLLSQEGLNPDSSQNFSIDYLTASLSGDRLLTRISGFASGEFSSRFLFMSTDGSDITSPQGSLPPSVGVSKPIPLPNNRVLFWYNDRACCEEGNTTQQVWITQDSDSATPRVVFDAAILGADKEITGIEVNSQGTHFTAWVQEQSTSVYEQDNNYSGVQDFLMNPPSGELIVVDIQNGTHTVASRKATAFAWSPNGDLLAVAIPEEGVINVVNASLSIIQTIDVARIQWTQALINNEELRSFAESLFVANGELTERLLGSVTEITWNPDASEFAFIVEDFLSFAAYQNYCGTEFLSPRDPLCNQITLSESNVVNHANVDGVYVADLRNGDASKVVAFKRADTLYVSNAADRVFSIDNAQISVPVDQQNFTNSAPDDFLRNANDVPLNQGLPFVQHRRPLLVNDYYIDRYSYQSTEGPDTLFWLNGGRELLINPAMADVSGVDIISPLQNPDRLSPFVPMTVNASQPASSALFLFSERTFEASSNDITGVSPTPFTKFLSFYSNDVSDKCGVFDETRGYRQFQSLLNLTSDLRVLRGTDDRGFRLEGSAIDKNFDRYELHYRDTSMRDAWTLIAPPSSAQVIDSVFTTWVPPYIGSFFVRLTVFDKAGNKREEIRRVINSDQSSISGVFISEPSFSPNGDDIKDTTAINFKVLNQVNIAADIFSADGVLVRSFRETFELIGTEGSIVWNGLDSRGSRVPDGIYKIVIQGFEFFIDIDTRFPVVQDISKPIFQPILNSKLFLGVDQEACERAPLPTPPIEGCLLGINPFLELKIDESQVEYARLEFKKPSESTWNVITEAFSFSNPGEQTLSYSINRLREARTSTEAFSLFDFRAVVADRSGNKTISNVGSNKINRAHFTHNSQFMLGRVPFDYNSSPEYSGLLEQKVTRDIFIQKGVNELELNFAHSIKERVAFYELFYRPLQDGEDVSNQRSVTIEVSDIGETVVAGAKQREVGENSRRVKIDLSTLPDYQFIDHVFFIRSHMVAGGYVDTGGINIIPVDSTVSRGAIRGRFLPEFDAIYFTSDESASDIQRVILSIKSSGPEADVRFLNDDRVTSDGDTIETESPDLVSKQLQGRHIRTIESDRLKPSSSQPGIVSVSINNRELQPGEQPINLIDNCGTDYTLNAVIVTRFGGFIDVESITYKGSCTDITVDVDPVYTQQCEAVPSNKVTVAMQPIDKSLFRRDNFPTPLTLQLGVPERTDQEQGTYPKVFRMGRVLHAVNLPEFGTRYEFEIDTTLFPVGKTELLAQLTLDDGTTNIKPIYLPIVKVPPTLNISYPAQNDRICADEYYSIRETDAQRIGASPGVEIISQIESDGPDLYSRVTYESNEKILSHSKVRFVGIDDTVTQEQAEAYRATIETKEVGEEISVGCNEVGCNHGLYDANGIKNRTERVNRSGFNYSRYGIYEQRVGELGSEYIQVLGSNSPPQLFRERDDARVIPSLVTHDYLGYRVRSSGIQVVAPFSESGSISLLSEARNWSGASVCSTTQFYVDAELEDFRVVSSGGIIVETPDIDGIERAFSPNGDGKFDELVYDITVGEAARVDMDVFEVTEESQAMTNPVSVSSPVQGQNIDIATTAISWDGTGQDGRVLADGVYKVVITVTDGCGHQEEFVDYAHIDNTPPDVRIDYPTGSQSLPILIRVLGEISDQVGASYELVAQDEQGVSVALSSGAAPVLGPIGDWNTLGLTGNWTLILNAKDALENSLRVEQQIELPVRQDLIASLETEDYYVSPNQDGRLDTLSIRVGLLRDANIDVLIKNQADELIRTLVSNQLQSDPYSTLVWDGKNEMGQVPPDGLYTVELTASNPTNQQVESIQFELDNTLPTINVLQLSDSVIELAGESEVNGLIQDANFKDLKVVLEPLLVNGEIIGSNMVVLEESQQPKDGLITTIPSFLLDSERAFTARFVANDHAGNRAQLSAELYLDILPPRLQILSPANDSIYNANAQLEVSASVQDRFLRDYRLRIVLAADGTEEILVAVDDESSDDIAEMVELAALQEGAYFVELSATDRSGLAAITTVAFVVDNTPPEVAINVPGQNEYLTELSSINGVANDSNFEQYELKIASGNDVNSAVFNDLTVSNQPVNGGSLYTLSTLPADGPYLLELSASDKAGNSSRTTRNFIVDTTPPTPVELVSAEFEKATSNIELEWAASTADDFAGYNLFRNGIQVNGDIITTTKFTDLDLAESEYTYYVQVVDRAGLISEPSNELKVTVDLTPPTVRISSPQNEGRVNLVQSVIGTAHSGDDFKIYRLFLIDANDNRRLIRESSVPVVGDELAQLNTLDFSNEARLTLLLEAEDIHDNKASDSIDIVVDNEPPQAPVLSPAQVNASNPADALLRWQHTDTAGDRLGFLLYRGEALLGVDGPVIGDLRPFAIQDLEYTDLELVDGTHRWVVYAIDDLGNTSEPSNVVELTLDNQPPTATIVNIENGHEFDNELYLLAGSQDLDIDHVQFEYMDENSSGTVGTWVEIGTVSSAPFEVIWDTDGLEYGPYQVRVVATDLGGKSDPAPAPLAVIKKDVEPPAQVKNLEISTNGPQGTLIWSDNDEPDLVGYHVYRANCEECEYRRLNTAPLSDSSYIDNASVVSGLGQRLRYLVRAIDASDNESVDSDTVIGVYVRTSFSIDERVVNTAVAQGRVAVGTAANGIEKVEFNVNTAQVPNVSVTQALSPAEDNVSSDIPLNGLGINGITALASSDSERFIGEVSKLIKVIAQGEPSVPENVQGAFADASAQVDISWSSNPAQEQISGYQVFKNGELLQASALISEVTPFSTHGVNIANSAPLAPESAFWDVNTTARNVVQFGQTWDDPSLVSKVELLWQTSSRAARTVIFEVLIDGEYVELGDHRKFFQDRLVSVELSKPVLTTGFRFTAREWESTFRTARLEKMSVFAETLQLGTTYSEVADPIPHDQVRYQVRAVDQYGGVGALSPAIEVAVGDVTPPQALVLSLIEQGSNKQLVWTESSEPNSTYRLYADGAEVVTQATTTYALPRLPNGIYTFTVVAIDPQGNISDPSNDVAVQINEPLLPAPIDLQAAYSELDNDINLSWQFNGDAADVVHYTVYVSRGDAQPFEKVDETQNRLYDFTQITQELRYHFYVTATDLSGNESPSSNTVTVTIPQVAFAGPPVITLPFDASGTVTANTNLQSILGFAEPGSNVTLFDGNLQQRMFTQANQVAALSEPLFDGTTGFNLIYEVAGRSVLVRLDFETGDTGFYRLSDEGQFERIVAAGLSEISFEISNAVLTSPNTLLIEMFDGSYKTLNVLTNVLSDVSLPSLSLGPIVQVLAFNEADQFMVVEIETDAFTGEFGVYRLDLQNPAQPVPQPLVSPAEIVSVDGAIYSLHPQSDTFVSLTRDDLGAQVIRVTDLLTGSQSQQSVNRSEVIFAVNDWSPSGRQLLLLSDDGAALNFEVLNVQTFEFTKLPLGLNISSAFWVSDRFVVSTQFVDIDSPQRLGLIDIQTGVHQDIGELPVLMQEPANPFNPFGALYFAEGWAERGRSLLISNDSDQTFEYQLAGLFVFSDVELEQGINNFSALSVSTDQAISELSNEVRVFYDGVSAELPDLQVALNVNRPAVLLGDTATVELTVSNVTATDSAPSVLTLLQTAPDGSTLEFMRKEVGTLEANSSVTLDAPFFPQVLGTHALFARIDADNGVEEVDETNNSTIAAIDVLASLDPRLSINLQAPATGGFSYPSGAQVAGTVALFNPGRAVTGVWNIEVVDAQNHLVDVIDTINVNNLALGDTIEQAFAWNSHDIFPGDYHVRSRFQPVNVSHLIMQSSPFSLYEDIVLQSALASNKLTFTDNEQVTLTATLGNKSSAVSLSEADVLLEVRDNQGALVFQETATLVNLIAGAQAQLPFFWNTGVAPAGEYFATVSTTQEDTVLGRADTRFLIQASNTVLGTLNLSSDRLTALDTLEYDSEVMNSGNASAGPVDVVYELVSGASVQELGTERLGTLDPSTARLLSDELVLAAYDEGTFLLRLVAELGPDNTRRVLDEKAFSVQEVTPPMLTIVEPSQGGVVTSAGLIARLTAQDDSGVKTVEYRVNNGPWLLANLSVLNTGFYEVDLSHLTEGSQFLQARATDNRDNVSGIESLSFEIDNTPPEISVLNIQEGQTFEGAVAPMVSVRDANPDRSTIWVDGVVLNGPITELGTHRIVIEAIDKANNSNRMERTFEIDRLATVSANDDRLLLRRGVWGTVRVLENDTLESINDGVVSITKQPDHGSLVRVGNGVYNYFPSLRFVGHDSFAYDVASEATGLSSSAMVSVDVAPSASCSLVADHSADAGDVVNLVGWANNQTDNRSVPRYRVEILGTSNNNAFAAGGLPTISYPSCDLRYTPKATARGRITVEYRIVDQATNGRNYTSQTRTFTLQINGTVGGQVIVPILNLLLGDD